MDCHVHVAARRVLAMTRVKHVIASEAWQSSLIVVLFRFQNNSSRIPKRLPYVFRNNATFFIIRNCFYFTLVIFNLPSPKRFHPIFMIYLLLSLRLPVKKQFHFISISISLYINHLPFVPVPIRKQTNKRLCIFSGPFRLKKIIGVFRETCRINLPEERRFCVIRCRLADIIPARPDILACTKRTIAVICNYSLSICAAPGSRTVAQS